MGDGFPPSGSEPPRAEPRWESGDEATETVGIMFLCIIWQYLELYNKLLNPTTTRTSEFYRRCYRARGKLFGGQMNGVSP